jgi:hypothetical protein
VVCSTSLSSLSSLSALALSSLSLRLCHNFKSFTTKAPTFVADEKKQQMKMAHTQELFRSDDPHLAEYGLEGDNQVRLIYIHTHISYT